MKNIIQIEVTLDDNKIPDKIEWGTSLPHETEIKLQKAKAILLSFWDPEDKTAMRLDLWSKDMRVDEMGDFFFQVFMTMADTFKRSNQHTTLDKDIRDFGKNFYDKFIQELKTK